MKWLKLIILHFQEQQLHQKNSRKISIALSEVYFDILDMKCVVYLGEFSESLLVPPPCSYKI